MTTEIFIRLPNGSYTAVQPEEAEFQKQLRGTNNVLDCPRCGHPAGLPEREGMERCDFCRQRQIPSK